MRKVMMIGTLALLFCGYWVPTTAAQQPIEGDWVGGFKIRDQYRFIRVHFMMDGKGLKASSDILFPLSERAMNLAIAQVSSQPSQLHFELPRDAAAFTFDGEFKDGTISGEVRQDGECSAFHLTRIAKVEPKILDEYSGVYQLEPGWFILIEHIQTLITQKGEPGSPLHCIDLKSGRLRLLFPLSETTFFAGPALLITSPVELKVTFIKSKQGEVIGLTWHETGSSEKSAPKFHNFKEEEVTFSNGDVTLAGTLTVPTTKAPHPAVIIIGHGPREIYLPLSRFFVSYGIAVLRYDKRGEGDSTGPRVEQVAFSAQAADALAAVEFLKSRNDVQPRQIGLWGLSQGGYIAPIAASRSKDVAFIITVSGPGVSPVQQELYRVENVLRERGFSEGEIAEAMAFFKRKFEVARTGEGWEQLAADAQQARAKKWFEYHGLPSSLDRLQWSWKNVWSYDPALFFENTTCPVLVLLGGMDADVPTKESVPRIEQALKKGGNKDYTIKVFPKGSHSLLEMSTGNHAKDLCYIKGFSPGYFETMANWILKRVDVGK
jgi:dienelactone hydrolase